LVNFTRSFFGAFLPKFNKNYKTDYIHKHKKTAYRVVKRKICSNVKCWWNWYLCCVKLDIEKLKCAHSVWLKGTIQLTLLVHTTRSYTKVLCYTVKLVYNDHPWDPKFVVIVDRWSLFRGKFMLWNLKMGLQNGGRCWQVVVIRRWSLAQVWLYIHSTLCTKEGSIKIYWHKSCSWNDCEICPYTFHIKN